MPDEKPNPRPAGPVRRGDGHWPESLGLGQEERSSETDVLSLDKNPEYKAAVREFRRRAFDRAVGHFARNLTKAADRIALLATEADSQSVQLQAARVVLRESLNVREHVDLEEQMEDIQRRLDERDAKVP